MSDRQFQPVILSAVRTPSGSFQGSLKGFSAPKLGALVLAEAVKRAGLENPQEIDEVYMGNVVSAGLGQNPARQAVLFLHAGRRRTSGWRLSCR